MVDTAMVVPSHPQRGVSLMTGASTPGVENRFLRPVLDLGRRRHAARAAQTGERRWQADLLPSLRRLRQEPAILAARSLVELLLWRRDALLLEPRQELRILQSFLKDALAVGFKVAAGLVHQAALVEPAHHLLARRSGIHHAEV